MDLVIPARRHRRGRQNSTFGGDSNQPRIANLEDSRLVVICWPPCDQPKRVSTGPWIMSILASDDSSHHEEKDRHRALHVFTSPRTVPFSSSSSREPSRTGAREFRKPNIPGSGYDAQREVPLVCWGHLQVARLADLRVHSGDSPVDQLPSRMGAGDEGLRTAVRLVHGRKRHQEHRAVWGGRGLARRPTVFSVRTERHTAPVLACRDLRFRPVQRPRRAHGGCFQACRRAQLRLHFERLVPGEAERHQPRLIARRNRSEWRCGSKSLPRILAGHQACRLPALTGELPSSKRTVPWCGIIASELNSRASSTQN